MTPTGTAGDDTLTGSAEADVFDLIAGGRDRANGLGGDDRFLLGASFAAGDRILGGDGDDVAELEGDYAGLLITAAMLNGVETVRLARGHDYSLIFADGVVAAGGSLTIEANDLAYDDAWSVDFSRERDAGSITFRGGKADSILKGGAGDDVFDLSNGFNQAWGGGGADRLDGGSGIDFLNGGGGADTLIGGARADVLTGGKGADVFRFNRWRDSEVDTPDRITDLTNQDAVDLSHIIDPGDPGEYSWTIVDDFTGGAYQLKIGYNAASDTTRILADIDGDERADMLIRVDGDHRDFDNFIL